MFKECVFFLVSFHPFTDSGFFLVIPLECGVQHIEVEAHIAHQTERYFMNFVFRLLDYFIVEFLAGTAILHGQAVISIKVFLAWFEVCNHPYRKYIQRHDFYQLSTAKSLILGFP